MSAQLGLSFEEAGPALTPEQERALLALPPVATVISTATVPGLRTRLMEALRRDVDSLSNERYMRECSPDVPDLIRERVADYRRRLEALEGE